MGVFLRSSLSAALAVALVLLFITSALAGLRSQERTDQVGAALAAEPAVQRVVVDVATDAALDTLMAGPLQLGPIAPLLRPLVSVLLTQFLATDAGQAMLADALADVIRQASFGPPLIVDLRSALAAALEIAPAPLGDVADELLFDDAAGLLLIDADGARTGDASEIAALRATRTTSIVGILSGRWALTLLAAAAMLLTLALVLLHRGARGAGGRPGAPAGLILAVSLPVALAINFTSEPLSRALARSNLLPMTGTGELTRALTQDVLPLLVTQFSALLGPTGLLASALAAGSIMWLSLVHLRGRAGD